MARKYGDHEIVRLKPYRKRGRKFSITRRSERSSFPICCWPTGRSIPTISGPAISPPGLSGQMGIPGHHHWSVHPGSSRFQRFDQSQQSADYNALLSAVNRHPPAKIIHSTTLRIYFFDYHHICASEYQTINEPTRLSLGKRLSGIVLSQFKIDLGDTDRSTPWRADLWGYLTIFKYNNSRIHSKLKMPPVLYSGISGLHGIVV